MKYEIGDLITLEDGVKYLIVDLFNFNNNTYMYVISDDGKNETTIYKVIDDYLTKLDNKDEFDKVLAELINRNRDEINKIIEEN
jgi:hypothetical protein